MKTLAALLIALAPAVALAQTAPPVPPKAPKRIAGVSDEGNAIINKMTAKPDPMLVAAVRQQRTLRDQIFTLTMASTVDVDRFESLLRSQEKAQADARARSNTLVVETLRALPEADRQAYLRSLIPNAPAPSRPVTGTAPSGAPR